MKNFLSWQISLLKKKVLTMLYGKSALNFLKDVSGVIHVGANTGQECEKYNKHGLNVVWVEPISQVFEELKHNIKPYNNQKAIQALVTDVDNKEYEFHIANNAGESSSIYELKYHKEIWPHIDYDRSISLKSTTLTSLLKRESIDASKYQALIMDAQGSELLILKGSIPILKHFNYINTEAADFEIYEGCCLLSQIRDFMFENGYEEYSQKIFAQSKRGGRCYDVTFKKIVASDLKKHH